MVCVYLLPAILAVSATEAVGLCALVAGEFSQAKRRVLLPGWSGAEPWSGAATGWTILHSYPSSNTLPVLSELVAEGVFEHLLLRRDKHVVEQNTQKNEHCEGGD